MTSRAITKGMGSGQGVGMVIHGFTFDDVVRGGRSLAKDIYKNLLEEFTIAAKLMEINGKELLAPIFNRRKYTIDESIQHKVSIKNVKVEKREIVEDTSVSAKLLRVDRGSDGEY